MYGSNRIQLDMMGVTYTQFREELSDLVENHLFKWIAMIKGFYETDKYGRPRWIFPRVTFGQMALRDSGDLYDMLFNMYSKGSLPVSIIYDFLGLDAESVRAELQDDLYTVADSKFNELLANIYGAASAGIVEKTDILKKIAKGLNLADIPTPTVEMEGSGEGM
jgi:hypothetical protein